jgi:hypothetical protein
VNLRHVGCMSVTASTCSSMQCALCAGCHGQNFPELKAQHSTKRKCTAAAVVTNGTCGSERVFKHIYQCPAIAEHTYQRGRQTERKQLVLSHRTAMPWHHHDVSNPIGIQVNVSTSLPTKLVQHGWKKGRWYEVCPLHNLWCSKVLHQSNIAVPIRLDQSGGKTSQSVATRTAAATCLLNPSTSSVTSSHHLACHDHDL